MNATICPTVTVDNAEAYQTRMESLAQFATRIHIDLADGVFAPTKLLPIDQVWWPGGMRADMHVMYQRPFEYLDVMVGLRPQLIVVHAEAEGDFGKFVEAAHKHGIEVGVALLVDTPVSRIRASLGAIDHVLVFAGKLGYHGGVANLDMLAKVKELKTMKPTLEIGWDGGVNDKVAKTLADGGVDVLNTGGFIAHAADPKAAYHQLQQLVV